MSGNQFIPKLDHVVAARRETEMVSDDGLQSQKGRSLLVLAQSLVVMLFAALPIFFVPGLWASLGFDKAMLALLVSAFVFILMMIAAFLQPRVRTILPLTLALFWMVVFAAFSSGLFSGDTQDAFRGSVLETQTVFFFAIMALAMSLPLVLQRSKRMTIISLAAFCLTGTVLLLYVITRLIFGADVLTFGSFNIITATPVGAFNDLAIFAGLITILGLVTLQQLPLKSLMQYGLVGLILGALFVLSIVNFLNIWIVLGVFSLVLFLYQVFKDRSFGAAAASSATAKSVPTVVATGLVCVMSAVFIFAGDQVGTKIGQLADVNYVEVRPSLEATIGIGKAVYAENAFFGIGPNRFIDAWQLHKDPRINETIFWDTDFVAGSGFVPTLFITLGLFGGIFMVLFHLGFVYLGTQMLLKGRGRDPYWYYFGLVSFTAACFIWGMSYVYIPGAAILLLGAFFTSLTFVAAGALLPHSLRTIPLNINRQRMFIMVAGAVVASLLLALVVYSTSKQYLAQFQFSKARVTATSLEAFDQAAVAAHELFADERFTSARAQVHLASLNALIAITEPTEAQQEELLRLSQTTLELAEQAVREDIRNADNHAILAAAFSSLARAGVGGAKERAVSSLAEAKRLDPLNPGYSLIAAQVAVRTGDVALARREIAAALELKPNFTPALYLSAQIDISEGKTDSAIETTRSIIRLEPNNATRYFQLGVLLAANAEVEQAIAAYRTAIALDPQYANARYLLAIALLERGEEAGALEQLRTVLQTNADNQELTTLIERIESGTYEVPTNAGVETLIEERMPTTDDEATPSTMIRPEDVTNDLVTPVNAITPNDSEAEAVEAANAAAQRAPTSDEVAPGAVDGEVDQATEASPAE